jgi:hypothetical protein
VVPPTGASSYAQEVHSCDRHVGSWVSRLVWNIL